MKYAFVTVLSTNDYYKGVIALFESLKQTNTKYPNFVVVVNEDIHDYILRDLQYRGYTIIKKNKIKIDFEYSLYKHWINTFDKFHIFDLEGYDKIVYLDCDILVVKNIDHLFELPNLSAVAAGQQMEKSLKAINSGMMVIEPCKGITEKLIKMATEISFESDFGDQDIIEAYFDWQNKNVAISEHYNLFADYIDFYIQNFNYNICEIAIIHFRGGIKPWMLSKNERESHIQTLEENGELYHAQFLKEYLKIIDKIRKKLCIITPFYNTLTYTKRLAKILAPQITDEVEWIIVDDGSYEFELDNLKARVIHLGENSGNASKPRNIGLEVTNADYITFIDSDDTVSDDYVEKIITKINEESFDYCYFSLEQATYNQKDIIENEPFDWNTSACNCIYSREIIGDEKFDETFNINEDGDFNQRVRKGKKAKSNILDIIYYYHFLQRPDSLCTLFNEGRISYKKADSGQKGDYHES